MLTQFFPYKITLLHVLLFCRAIKSNQEEIVQLIFDIKADHGLFQNCCGKDWGTVFHDAIENPKVLEYLLTQFVTVWELHHFTSNLKNKLYQ